MSKSGRAAKSAVIVMAFILASKAMGFFREILIAAVYGSGETTDTYYLVYKGIGIFISILNSAILTTLLPIFSEINEKKGKGELQGFAGLMMNTAGIFTVLLTLVIWIISPWAVKILGPGFSGEQVSLAVELFRVGFIMIIFVMITSFITVYMHYHEQFTIPAASGIPLNIVVVGFLLLFAGIKGIEGLMTAMVVGYGIQLLIMILFLLKMKYKHSWLTGFQSPYLKKTLGLAVPVMIGTTVQQINTVIDTNLASQLKPGSLSSLSYASKLEEVIVGVFILTVSSIFFPMLTKEFSHRNYTGMKEIMSYGINFILLVTIPVTVGVFVLSQPLVKLFFERGMFDETATAMTSMAFIFYSIGLTGIGIREMASKMFYSIKDTKTPMLIGVMGVFINVTLNLILIRYLEHSGLALATSIATLVSALLMMIVLRKKLGTIKGSYLLQTALKISLASGVMGLTLWLFKPLVWRGIELGFSTGVIYLTLVILAGGFLYGVLCYLLDIKELKLVINKGQGYLKRKGILKF